MECEILFRGQRADDGAWVYGWYSKFAFNSWPPRDCIILKDDAEGGYLHHEEVDPATLGQYTGLTDKNGVRIFEGDVVKSNSLDDFDEKYLFEVRFGRCGGVQNVLHDVGYVGFYLSPASSATKMCSDFGLRNDILFWINEDAGISVVGNIHDNPELLGGNDETD